jgi:hypothetical protein
MNDRTLHIECTALSAADEHIVDSLTNQTSYPCCDLADSAS